MAGVLEHLRRFRRKLVKDYESSAKRDLLVLELKTAMEILAEVFGTNISEIDEMLKPRCVEAPKASASYSQKSRQARFLSIHAAKEMNGPWSFAWQSELLAIFPILLILIKF